MSWFVSVDSEGGGADNRPWWDFPTPFGPPSTQHMPGACWNGPLVVHGEEYWQPVMCNGGLPYPQGTTFPNGTPWQEWFGSGP